MSEKIEENVRAHETYLGGLFYGREEARAEAEAEIAEVKAEADQKLKETQKLIVKNLLENSVSDDIILKSTNISIEELDNIKKEIR